MSILYLFPEPLPLQKARGIQVINTVASLAAQGMHVYLAYVPVQSVPDPFAAYGLDCPPSVTLVPISRSLPWPLSFLGVHSGRLFFLRLLTWIRRKKSRGEAPRIVMVRHIKLAHWLLEAELDIPVVYEAHEVFADGASTKKAKRLSLMEKAVLQRASTIIAITEQLAIKLRQRYEVQREIAVIPSATALPAITPSKDWSDLGHSIVYAGSLYGWKGAQDLVAAAKFLPGCHISVIGGDAKGIDALRASLGKGGATVEFLGHLPHGRVMEQLGKACIAVLPNRKGSVSEFTSPLKLFEYMAAGCAIVVSDLPVFHEVLGQDDAAWFAPGEPEGLTASIRRLLDNPKRTEEMGQRMQAMAKNYTWDARAKRLANLFQTLENQRAPGAVA
ncbi:MAG TPA: glycosyltransferase family 4 protein [Rhodocyclaceae bacterium]|nr:glycosyltransferase family 4 protein [Rhodocyclaceae bacterium]